MSQYFGIFVSSFTQLSGNWRAKFSRRLKNRRGIRALTFEPLLALVVLAVGMTQSHQKSRLLAYRGRLRGGVNTGIKILVFSARDDALSTQRAFRAGARGFLVAHEDILKISSPRSNFSRRCLRERDRVAAAPGKSC
jgi:hypothetical protein